MTRPPALSDAAARTAILVAADRAFYAGGVAGVGMAEVRDAAGISLKRLYGLYPSKRELVAAWLEARHGTWMAWFDGAVDRLAADGTDPLLAAFDAIAEWAATPGYRGCAFLNTAAEATAIDDEHRAIIARHKRELTASLAARTRAAGRPDPDALATVIAVLLDGAIVQAAVLRDPNPVAAARAAAARLIGDLP